MRSINVAEGVGIGYRAFYDAGCAESIYEAGDIICWCEKETAMPCPTPVGSLNCIIAPDSNGHVDWPAGYTTILRKVRARKQLILLICLELSYFLHPRDANKKKNIIYWRLETSNLQ